MSLKLMSAVIPTSSSSTPSSSSSSLIVSTQSKPEDSSRLLNQLLECVQQCQKRFGGKTELATEFDSCVAALCLTLESVLLHGLRQKSLSEGQTSTLKHVSDIVSNTLHLSNDNISFWPFVSKHLTKHEKERYSILKQIWTDTGRGKAWIRSALNEKTLERYFHTILSNRELLRCYYEDWALILDEEKNSMLPNMAAGLGSILFAISIDKSELNAGNATEKMDKLKALVEPIIQAPIPDNNVHKKRVVPKQIISFDDDENALSSSVPSSSSSITSDTNSSNELQTKSDIKTSVTERQSESSVNKDKLKRKLSIETSGSREKFQNSIDGPLTPIQCNIGELTPISVETNVDSPEINETLSKDIPIDISAVFTEIEKKNQEFVKLNDKIALLDKENHSLKEQLKKYVGAVQMLKQGNGSLQKALEDLQVEGQHPDYKHEAKIFEKKLVQVAEMHAELMDFNVHLQQSLCQKDKVIERLVEELEELRGPMPLDEISEDSRHSINVWIPSAFLTGSGSDVHHVYQIFLRAGCDEWNIYRRYAQFYALHSDLKKLDPTVSTFDFPPKKSLGKRDAALVEDRRKRFQTYLRRVLTHWPELTQCNSRFLLEQHLAFFKDKDNDKNKIFSSKRSPANDNHYTGL